MNCSVFKIAVATRSLGQPLQRSLRIATELHAQGIQLGLPHEQARLDLSETGCRQFQKNLRDLGLGISSLFLPMRRSYSDPELLDERVAAAKTALMNAHRLNAKVVTTPLGPIPEDSDSASYGLLVEVLNDLARHANHVGSILAVTASSDASQTIRKLIDQVTEGPIGVDFDAAGFLIAGDDPCESFRNLHDCTVHVQVRDAARNLGASEEWAEAEVPVGSGDVPWIELLALLDEAGYRNWLTIVRNTGDDKLGDIQRAVHWLREVTLH